MSDESIDTIPLRQYWALLGKYLRPHLGWVTALAVLLFSGVGMQLVSPQIMRRFIDGAGDNSVPLDAVLASALLFVRWNKTSTHARAVWRVSC